MSERQNGVLITAPLFGTGVESAGCFTGYVCGYCQGNGWFWNPDIVNERVKMACPKCGGTGKVKAVVTIEWQPDGEVKHCLKEK